MERQTPDSRGQEEDNPFYYGKSRKYTQGGATVYVKVCSHQWQKHVACEELNNLLKLNIRQHKTLLHIQCKLVDGLYSDN